MTTSTISANWRAALQPYATFAVETAYVGYPGGGDVLALIPGIPGMYVEGPTRLSALDTLNDRLLGWLEAALNRGGSIPTLDKLASAKRLWDAMMAEDD